MDSNLAKTIQQLVISPKGILAADESLSTMEKRLAAIGVFSNKESRHEFRNLLFTTPDIEEFISGVILYDETMHDLMQNGENTTDYLTERGIIVGLKVDEGTLQITASSIEKTTKGLGALEKRLAGLREKGIRFTKWRAVFSVGDGLPSEQIILKNVSDLTRFAILSQQAGLVPIVEPEVLMDGAHSIDECENATRRVLHHLFEELSRNLVRFDSLLLKTNMIVQGKDNQGNVSEDQVAQKTHDVLRKSVPSDVGGVVFLSGGLDAVRATSLLNAICKITGPWPLSFSFSRALEEPVLKAWMGKEENQLQAQRVFLKRARLNSLARLGEYSDLMEQQS